MSRAVVLALMLFFIFTTNGKRILRERESLHEQLANQFHEVDLLPEGAFIEDSSGGKIFYSITIVRRFFFSRFGSIKTNTWEIEVLVYQSNFTMGHPLKLEHKSMLLTSFENILSREVRM